jgi:hypothetical protein
MQNVQKVIQNVKNITVTLISVLWSHAPLRICCGFSFRLSFCTNFAGRRACYTRGPFYHKMYEAVQNASFSRPRGFVPLFQTTITAGPGGSLILV